LNINEQLIEIQEHFGVISSEIILIMGSIILLILGMLRLPLFWIKVFVAVVLLGSFLFAQQISGFFFTRTIIRDDLSYLMTQLLPWVTLGVLCFKRQTHQSYEFYFLLMSVLIGSLFMVGSHNLLILYLAIELTSYASYLLTGFHFNEKGSEAAMKYLLFGGVSSAVMLFGISLLYGAHDSLYFDTLEFSLLGATGLFFFLSGLFFKTSIVPFHIWVPATYEGAPTDAVAFFSTVPKIAGFAALYHVFKWTNGLFNPFLEQLILLLAILTIVWGTLAALRQTDVKRMLSYGAVAHSGFILPLCLVMDTYSIFKYYVIIYAFMNILAFLFVQLHEKEGENLSLSNVSGLGIKFPLLGVISVIWAVALVGLPPTGGFMAKLFLFSTAWQHYGSMDSLYWLTFICVGVLSSAASLYFYLRVPYFYFFKEDQGKKIRINKRYFVILTLLAFTLILLFIQPNILDRFAPMINP